MNNMETEFLVIISISLSIALPISLTNNPISKYLMKDCMSNEVRE